MLDLIRIFKNEFGKTKKYFGQHFLTNKHILELIVKSADITEGDNVVEIGPGCGVLTQELLETKAKVTSIEIDKELAEFLKRYLFFYPNFTIINEDFMNVNLNELGENITFVGNLPYNFSVKIVQKCIENIDNIKTMVFMFQKEVADRISTIHGNKTYSSLSVYTQYYFDIKKIKHFGGGNFWPKTKVTSSILKFTPKERYYKDQQVEQEFLKFVEKAFVKKRKTLKNNLNDYENIEKVLDELFSKPSIRAEELSPDDFIKLFDKLYS
jgi:16S rRNA (adenine1518-N6/adenine1519-N6)-dimethyltransferase